MANNNAMKNMYDPYIPPVAALLGLVSYNTKHRILRFVRRYRLQINVMYCSPILIAGNKTFRYVTSTLEISVKQCPVNGQGDKYSMDNGLYYSLISQDTVVHK